MDNDSKSIRQYAAGLIFLALLVSFAFQGTRGLYETSEGRYAEIAREMMERGDYLEPTMGYRPHWTKPPMTYWAIAAGMGLLGRNEWGVRLFNGVAFFATIFAVVSMGGTLWDRKTGLIAGAVYATSLYPMIGAHMVTTDTLLTLWEVCAVLCYLKAYYGSVPGEGRWWTTGMWLFFGLGFMTKGPPALLPLMPMVVWSIRNKRAAALWSLSGAALFLVAGLSWYLVVILRHPNLLAYFLFVEAVEKISSSTVQNAEWYKPFILYIPALTLGAGPWLHFGLRTLWRKGLFKPGALWRCLNQGGPGGFLLLWLLLPLAVFFLARGRLFLYVLPLYAPLTLAMARGISTAGERFSGLRKVMIVAGISGLLLIGLKGAASVYPVRNNMARLYDACRAVGMEGRRFIVFDDPRLYGLQFYLDGRLDRATPGRKEPWADYSVEDALSRARGAEPHPSCVFVADRGRTSDLRKILKKEDVLFQEVDGRFWSLIVTLPPSRRAGGLS